MQLPKAPTGSDPIEASWGRQVVDYLRSLTPTGLNGVSVKQGTSGTTFSLDRPTQFAPALLPFQIYQTGLLTVKVNAGRIIVNGLAVDMATSGTLTCPASSSTFSVWIDLGSGGEFALPPSPSFGSGNGGWTGYPTQANPPAVRYLLLAILTSNTTNITGITVYDGNANLKWPTVFGFWG